MAEKCKEKRLREWLTAYAFDLLEDPAAQEVAHHLLHCPACSEELLRITELKHALRARPEEHLSILDEVRAQRMRSRWIPTVGFRALLYASAFLMLLAIVWLSTHSLPPPFLQKGGLETRGPIRLIEPRGSLSRVPRAFRWAGMGAANVYVVEIRNLSAKKIVFTATQPETTLILPEAAVQKFQPGIAYIWTVKALDLSGQLVTESAEEFIIY